MVINLNNKQTEAQDITELQKETMETMSEYITTLAPKMSAMVEELRTNIQEDSWEFLRMMIDGFNWVLEAYNGTSSLINKNSQVINNEEVEKSVNEFGKAFRNQNAEETADIMEKKIIPFLNTLVEAISVSK